MGIPRTLRMIELGQIICAPYNKGVIVNIPYTCDESCRLGLIIQNKSGRSVYESSLILEAETGILEIEIQHLEEGDYNAWIDVKGDMFIRNFTVPASPQNGVWAWLKGKLS